MGVFFGRNVIGRVFFRFLAVCVFGPGVVVMIMFELGSLVLLLVVYRTGQRVSHMPSGGYNLEKGRKSAVCHILQP